MKNYWSIVCFLGLCCLFLVALWLPGIRYPVVSDSLSYARLGESFWLHGTYVIGGVPFSKQLPLHAILSYPFTALLGLHLGMHASTLVDGFLVLIAAFFFSLAALRASKQPHAVLIACGVTITVLTYPAFVLMTMLGSADLLFCALFLFSLYFYIRAGDDKRWYLAAGAMAGLACLARYNGIPLFALFPGYALWKRRGDLRSKIFWAGLALGAAIFGIWLLRNAIVFGNPLYTDYTGELQQQTPSITGLLVTNVIYYLNPVHNIFPFFFVFALIGLWTRARREPFLILAMITAGLLSVIWHTQGIRFFFPAFVILLYFSVLGIVDVIGLAVSGKRLAASCYPLSAMQILLVVLIVFSGVAIQSVSLCMYTYGSCNAWVDRNIGIFPKDMHLTSEGFYTWDLARQYIDTHAETGAVLRYETSEAVGVFRPDLRATDDPSICPAYAIKQILLPTDKILFQTQDVPVTYVVKEACAGQK